MVREKCGTSSNFSENCIQKVRFAGIFFGEPRFSSEGELVQIIILVNIGKSRTVHNYTVGLVARDDSAKYLVNF
jgi:hypothetical protein